MSIFETLFHQAEHDAKPLLQAAAHWAESVGLDLVRQIETEIAAFDQEKLAALFNLALGPSLGIQLPLGVTLAGDALDLLITALARTRAAGISGRRYEPRY